MSGLKIKILALRCTGLKTEYNMIDFLKLQVNDNTLMEKFYLDERLTFHDRHEKLSHFDFETIYAKETRTYNGVLFCFNDRGLEILFRPHYYYNGNTHNANDFSVEDCTGVLSEFINTFELTDLNKYRIVNIEFGVNAISDIPVKQLITHATYHQRSQFLNDDGLRYSKKSYTTNRNGKANSYKTIKLYAKSLQFPQYADENLFRFEIKSKKSQYIKRLGIENLSDVLQFDTYLKLKETILNEFKDVLILYNHSNIEHLTKRQRNTLQKYLNTYTWYDIQQKHRNEFNKTKNRYQNLLDKTGYNIHKVTYDIMKNKLDILTGKKAEKQNETGAYLPPFEKTKQVRICLLV